MISYAGVPLPQPTSEVSQFISDHISYEDIPLFTYRSWPGRNLTGLTFPTGFYPVRRIVLNRLYWFTGASRFGYGHFLCDANSLAKIQSQATGSCSQFNKLPLVVADQKGGSISPNLYLAATTPLSGIRKVNGMFLISLVDARWLWWSVSTPDFGIGPGTTWDSLYAACQSKLGQAISRDAVDPSYLQPSPTLNLAYEAFPLVLDAIAYNCGQRVTLGLDGKIRVLNYSSSSTTLSKNLSQAGLSRRAGDSRFPSVL